MGFSNSSDGSGISIIDEQCAIRTSGNVYIHIAKYYSSINIYNKPPIFLRLNSKKLPSHCIIEQSDGSNGDKCHRNLKNLSNKQAKTFFKNHNFDCYFICKPETGITKLSKLKAHELNIKFNNKR